MQWLYCQAYGNRIQILGSKFNYIGVKDVIRTSLQTLKSFALHYLISSSGSNIVAFKRIKSSFLLSFFLSERVFSNPVISNDPLSGIFIVDLYCCSITN